MKIEINIRHLEKKAVRLQGELPPEEAELLGLDELVRPTGGIVYDLTATRQGADILVEGTLSLELECDCSRCLKPYRTRVELAPWKALVPLEGEESVSISNDSVDLTPFVREDIVLSFPQHPLCNDECSGLVSPPQTGSLNKSGDRKQAAAASAWAALDKLKL